MNILSYLLDLFLHLDTHLGTILDTFGPWTYVLLFGVIFLETGFVVTPFLPGDSLLFASGAFAALGYLNLAWLLLLLALAAILGDTVNYWIGHLLREQVHAGKIRFIKKAHLERTHAFYEKHGGKAVVLGRFVPIVRTFVPFVAGVGAMTYPRFIFYNIFGGALWASLFLGAGYFFGNIPVVKENFTFVVLGIIVVSVLPMITEYLKGRRAPEATPAD